MDYMPLDIYGAEVRGFIDGSIQLTENYITAIQAVCDAFEKMPRCVFDVLRARSFFTLQHDTIEENGQKARLGIRHERFAFNMNSISENIKEEQDYGLE